MTTIELPDWVPDWATTIPHGHRDAAATPPPVRDLDQNVSAENANHLNQNDDGFTRIAKSVLVGPSSDRTVHRKLRGKHLFMITLNATLGSGLYWRAGHALEVGGAISLVLSFVVVGALAWAVMQCIAEMLCLWPIPGALSVYVRTFVDDELGIAVGLAYWFTYSVSFAAILVTVAAEVAMWSEGRNAINGIVIYFILPVALVLINAVEVGVGLVFGLHGSSRAAGLLIYGWIEVAFGTIKLILLAFVTVVVVAVTFRDGKGVDLWSSNTPLQFDGSVAHDLPTAFLISTSITVFAYVGVEIIAAAAIEARGSGTSRTLAGPEVKGNRAAPTSALRAEPNATTLIGQSVRFTAIYLPIIITGAYTLSSLVASFYIARDHCSLPRLSWATISACGDDTEPTSVFVIIAKESGIPGLEHVFNVAVVFTAVTCANTNLYVASRSLFGLTTRLDGGRSQRLYVRLLAMFGKTDGRGVPIRAVIFSALAFCWVPYIQLIGDSDPSNPGNVFIEVLGQMGSIGVIIVWACNCLAFIRFYHCIDKHQDALNRHKIPRVRRHDHHNDEYPYRSFGQPYLAYAAFVGCLFILAISGSSQMWMQFGVEPFLSSYLCVFVFLGFWLVLKLLRGGDWSLVDLSYAEKVVEKLQDLNEICVEATLNE